MEDLKNTINQPDLRDISRTLYPTTTYPFFSNTYGAFLRIRHMLKVKSSLKGFEKGSQGGSVS